MIEVETTYKEYPLRATLNYNPCKGYTLFFDYELSGSINKKINFQTLDLIQFLIKKEKESIKTEDYEICALMKKMREKVLQKLEEYDIEQRVCI